MRDKILLIKAKGGLGNRMLSAVTGLIYADLAGRRPVVDWRDGIYAETGVNAYPLLFDTPLTQGPEDVGNAASVTPDAWIGHLEKSPVEMIEAFDRDRHSSPTIHHKYCVDLRRTDHPEDMAVFWCYLPKMPRLARHLARDPRFAGRDPDAIFAEYLARYFTPNARVRAEVDRLTRELPRPVLGVHIRYTDLKIPLGKVRARIRARLETLPGATIFLATDNAEVQAQITAEFGDVRVAPKYLPPSGQRLNDHRATHDKRLEAENAMIDMWMLAGCDHLIYSRNSTFSISAALIGDLPRDRQDDVDRFNPAVVLKRFVQARI